MNGRGYYLKLEKHGLGTPLFVDPLQVVAIDSYAGDRAIVYVAATGDEGWVVEHSVVELKDMLEKWREIWT